MDSGPVTGAASGTPSCSGAANRLQSDADSAAGKAVGSMPSQLAMLSAAPANLPTQASYSPRSAAARAAKLGGLRAGSTSWGEDGSVEARMDEVREHLTRDNGGWGGVGAIPN